MRQLKITQSITKRDTDSLDKYLQDISKLEMITAEEEVHLAKEIRKGNTEALQQLVSANLRFVVSVAKQYQNNGLALTDLINEGNIGLVKAAQRFDEKRGFKFISYAVWWIRQSIIHSIGEHARMVRLPLNQLSSIRQLKRKFTELEQKYGREPSNSELAEEMEMPENKLIELMSVTPYAISVDAPLKEGESDHTLVDVLENSESVLADDSLIKESLHKEIKRILNTLPSREAEVVRLYYGIGMKTSMTLEEIGEHLELTRERIRQIKEKAIRKLRHVSRSDLLRKYL